MTERCNSRRGVVKQEKCPCEIFLSFVLCDGQPSPPPSWVGRMKMKMGNPLSGGENLSLPRGACGGSDKCLFACLLFGVLFLGRLSKAVKKQVLFGGVALILESNRVYNQGCGLKSRLWTRFRTLE